MKSLSLVALFFIYSSAPAVVVDLCDAECYLTIDFPDGGSMHAPYALTITFGDNGLIDTGGSITAYAAGETYTLNAGEILDFDHGGSFDIGEGGNINYTRLEITTSGTVDLVASGEPYALAGQLRVFKVTDDVLMKVSAVLFGFTDFAVEGSVEIWSPITGDDEDECPPDASPLAGIGIGITDPSSPVWSGPTPCGPLVVGPLLGGEFSFPDAGLIEVADDQGSGGGSSGGSGSLWLGLCLLLLVRRLVTLTPGQCRIPFGGSRLR